MHSKFNDNNEHHNQAMIRVKTPSTWGWMESLKDWWNDLPSFSDLFQSHKASPKYITGNGQVEKMDSNSSSKFSDYHNNNDMMQFHQKTQYRESENYFLIKKNPLHTGTTRSLNEILCNPDHSKKNTNDREKNDTKSTSKGLFSKIFSMFSFSKSNDHQENNSDVEHSDKNYSDLVM